MMYILESQEDNHYSFSKVDGEGNNLGLSCSKDYIPFRIWLHENLDSLPEDIAQLVSDGILSPLEE
jgi:hypothetical protein